MRLRFYIDIWPGMSVQYGYFANTNPPAKASGSKRIAFDVTIPDELIHEPDVVAPEVSRPVRVIDHEDPTP